MGAWQVVVDEGSGALVGLRDTRSGRFEASLYRVDLAVAGLHVDSDAGRPTASADTSARQPRRVQPDLPHDQLSLLN